MKEIKSDRVQSEEDFKEHNEVFNSKNLNSMSRTKSLILISLFVSLLCISGLFLKVTFVPPVAFSMTSFFAIFSGAILEKKKAL